MVVNMYTAYMQKNVNVELTNGNIEFGKLVFTAEKYEYITLQTQEGQKRILRSQIVSIS